MFESGVVEGERYRHELERLRQVILRAEPAVLFDGRFEDMITAPVTTIAIAAELIGQMSVARRSLAVQANSQAVWGSPRTR